MKLIYFTTVCNSDTFDHIVKNSRLKPSAAPQTFESLLLKGMSTIKELSVKVITFPIISVWPKGNLLFWGKRKEVVEGGYISTWLPALNFHVIKQLCYSIFAYNELNVWLRDNKNIKDKAILIYSIYAPIVSQILRLCRKYSVVSIVIIPDIPEYMYATRNYSRIKKLFSKMLSSKARMLQDKFDGYILFTEQMNTKINHYHKLYMILEGITYTGCLKKCKTQHKRFKKVIMYAGAINENLGIKTLIEAFIKLQDSDYQLWLFGSGDFELKVKAYANIDNRIKYFGRVERRIVLDYERQASLLVNLRNPDNDYTKYSFPSKIIEYMLSDTPILTTRLEGMPCEYYKYIYSCDANVDSIKAEIERIFRLNDKERYQRGVRARNFIINNKNYIVQSKRLYHFICKIIGLNQKEFYKKVYANH